MIKITLFQSHRASLKLMYRTENKQRTSWSLKLLGHFYLRSTPTLSIYILVPFSCSLYSLQATYT